MQRGPGRKWIIVKTVAITASELPADMFPYPHNLFCTLGTYVYCDVHVMGGGGGGRSKHQEITREHTPCLLAYYVLVLLAFLPPYG